MAKFRTRARAIDLLGRQQIAGVPTAISELFKNAHDAYAKTVRVDFFRKDGLFVLRDDGVGMTREDFEQRWLVLGTESKLATNHSLGAPYTPLNMPARPIMGEKGIGRLAIGLIGRQVLITTRAMRGNQLGDLVACFIHWGLFAAAGIDLDEIEIPISIHNNNTIPDASDVSKLVNVTRQNVRSLTGKIGGAVASSILVDLDNFKLDPAGISKVLGKPSLKSDMKGESNGHGTQFYVLPAIDTLADQIDEDETPTGNAVFTKFLLGFTNTMFPGKEEPPMTTGFGDWRTEEAPIELLGGKSFFTPDEFSEADHHITGRFDENGQFVGTVSVYGQTGIPHVVSWSGAPGHTTLCGPFEVNIAYLQGERSESQVPPQEWASLKRKLDRIGGLYVYRDDIRVLPYGNSDYDWLNVEYNRTKSAGYYYFSYRRIFGAVSISRKFNSNLIEKAGREGFQENKAYRQFRDILSNFFLQLAADFFRDTGDQAEAFFERRAELREAENARKKREKLVSIRRKNFEKQLGTFFEAAEKGQITLEVQQLVANAKSLISRAIAIEDTDKSAVALVEAEANIHQELQNIRGRFRVSKPKDVGLSRKLEHDWRVYQEEQIQVERTLFGPTAQEVAAIIGGSASMARVHIDQRRRLTKLLREVASESKRSVNREADYARETATSITEKIVNLTRKAVHDLDDAIQKTETELETTSLDNKQPIEIEAIRNKLQRRIDDAANHNRELLESVRNQLLDIELVPDISGKIVGKSEMSAALEQELIALKERADNDAELAQLGMAIEVIDHEFNAAILQIRTGLQEFGAWAKSNRGLNPLYNKIRTSFEHLDGYLTLFTPFSRRLRRQKVEISGAQITKFIKDLFGERFLRHNVDLDTKSAFNRMIIFGYPSTFYPVFVNLIDNAIFWLSDRPAPRIIELDMQDGALLVRDNGPGIPNRDMENVFRAGFSRKPGGRGLGLHISKEALQKTGYELKILKTGQEGTTFAIQQTTDLQPED